MKEIAITKGIKVSVEAIYMESNSRPKQQYFVHAYKITIENQSTESVQLLRRHWFIQDGKGMIQEIEGEGVVGKQPILEAGQFHQYTSWCPLNTEVGRMYGTFTMQNRDTEQLFKITIPPFKLIASPILN